MKKHLSFLFFALSALFVGAQQIEQPKEVKELSEALNSEVEESMPVLSDDGRLYFVRTFFEGNQGGKSAGQDIWYIDLTSGEIKEPTNDLKKLNNRFNNAVVSVVDSGRTLYLNGTYSNKPQFQKGISKSVFTGGAWSKPKEQRIKKYRPANNYITFYVDQSEQYMFMSFATEEDPENEDLFVSKRVRENKWSEPVNLGDRINTEADEFAPFLDADGKTLYFSSGGHATLGGIDIFSSVALNSDFTSWELPNNPGAPINSKAFDAYFARYGDKAFLSSNRGGGASDLFKVNFSDDESMTISMIGGIEDYRGVEKATVRVLDPSGNLVEETPLAADGSFKFDRLPKDNQYGLSIVGLEDSGENIGRIFLLNNAGEKVYLNKNLVGGSYAFKTLQRDVVAVDTKAENDTKLAYDDFMFDYNTLPPAGTYVYLYDENDNIIDSALVDANGAFRFKKLDPDGKYFLRMNESDYDMQAAKVYAKNSSVNLLLSKGEGGFVYEPIIDREHADVDLDAEMDGKLSTEQYIFDYENLPPEGTMVYLYDEDDNLIDSASVNANGGFEFKRLVADDNYIIRVDEDSYDTDGAKLYAINNGVKRPMDVVGDGFRRSAVRLLTVDEPKLDVDRFLMEYQGAIPTSASAFLTESQQSKSSVEAAIDEDGSFEFPRIDRDKTYQMSFSDNIDQSKVKLYSIAGGSQKELPNADGFTIDPKALIDPAAKAGTVPKPSKVEVAAAPMKAKPSKAAAPLSLTVNFDFNQVALSSTEMSKLNSKVSGLKGKQITLIGHTDNVGSEGVNIEISNKRAASVKAVLVQAGLSPDRIKTVGKGEAAPIASNDTEAGRAENRRVVVSVD